MRKFIYFSRIKSLIATYVGAFGNNKRPRLPLRGMTIRIQDYIYQELENLL